jgi:hypothetical protein
VKLYLHSPIRHAEVLSEADVKDSVFFDQLFVALRRIFGQKGDEMTRGWRKVHNEELHNLYFSPGIIRMIRSRRMRWAGHVAGKGRRRMHIRYWWGSQKERDHCEDQDVGGWIILKWILVI